jgi:peptidoglycan/xylan/chitin deacetylase (PgdA/CDA1 family)
MPLSALIAAALLAPGPGEMGAVRVFTALAWVGDAAAPSVVLRSFETRGRPFYLIVDPRTLETRTAPAAAVRVEPRSWSAVRTAIADTAYGRALAEAERNEAPLQDAGLTHLLAPRPGVDLTVDLCPSRRPLDRGLFTALVEELGRYERPVPVAVALTGTWMREHPEDLAWLVSLARTGALAVTWVNHSFHHRSSPTLPLRENFLLEPGTDLTSEVLETEAAMLAAGITPSVFFRFPGLVSRPALFGRIVAFGLVPLGSDAWLAKNEWPREGSIVLVHANGNEPLGVRRFLQLLRDEREAIRTKSWQLLDLRESVAATEEPR